MMSNIAPCKGCCARDTNCHAHCKDYKRWLRSRQAEKEAVDWNRARDADVLVATKRGGRIR